jgi:hypothetical protein
LFAEVSNRSHAGKAVANLNTLNYNYNLSKFSATYQTIMEKLRLIELLDSKEQQSIYNIVDGLVASKKLRDTLSNALNTGLAL